MNHASLALSVLLSTATVLAGQSAYPTGRVLTHREQAPLIKGWIQKRFDTLLPGLMQREKIDMWIIVSREYNDDPVFRSMSPLTTYSSRRRTILVFHVYLGFSTDTQHNAYVLLPGETDAPAGLKAGLKAANRLQDLTMKYATLGGTGNAALTGALQQAKAEGLTPSIYCHPVGYHGHAAGPPIGMTDYQNGVPVRGDYIFRPDSWHSIELNVRHPVPEWGNQRVMFALEEDAALFASGWDWIDGRQTTFYLIK